MTFVLRAPFATELAAFSSCLDGAFGVKATPKERQRYMRTLLEAAPYAAFDGDELIGTLTRQLVDLTLPGPITERVAAISDIGVLPTYRRQGVMTALLEKALFEIRAQGSPIAVLHAHDGSLYRRFGFGPATYGARYRIVRSEAALRHGEVISSAKGSVQLLGMEQARSCLPAIFSDVAATRPGEIARSGPWWDELFEQFDESLGAPRFFACYESDGSIDGYVIYDIDNNTSGDLSTNETHLHELCAATPAAYRELYRFLLELDGPGIVSTAERPVDEPLRQSLIDPRALRILSIRDRSWVRLIDVEAALVARRFEGPGEITISVRDSDFPWNNDTFRLVVDDRGMPSVTRQSDEVDLRCEVSDLGAVFLGAINFSLLAATLSVTEEQNGALRRADQLFYVPTAPFCSSAF